MTNGLRREPKRSVVMTSLAVNEDTDPGLNSKRMPGSWRYWTQCAGRIGRLVGTFISSTLLMMMFGVIQRKGVALLACVFDSEA